MQTMPPDRAKREDCITRNILYESQCEKCLSDEKRSGGNASLYVGESARSLFERSCEHWQATSQKKEESHMHQHMVEEHSKEMDKPEFRFKVVKTFKSALDRQVAEAIRIEMRGNVLNRRGEFNRCSLTRLGIDYEWEEERWKKSVESVLSEREEPVHIEESVKSRGAGGEQRQVGAKRRKLDVCGKVWGECVENEHQLRLEYLRHDRGSVVAKPKQSKLRVLTGLELVAYQLVQELANSAVDKAWDMDYVDKWDEWQAECSGSVDEGGLADSMPTDPQTIMEGVMGSVVGGIKLPPTKPKMGKKKKCEVRVDSSQKPVR